MRIIFRTVRPLSKNCDFTKQNMRQGLLDLMPIGVPQVTLTISYSMAYYLLDLIFVLKDERLMISQKAIQFLLLFLQTIVP